MVRGRLALARTSILRSACAQPVQILQVHRSLCVPRSSTMLDPPLGLPPASLARCQAAAHCPLGYPARFEAAASFIRGAGAGLSLSTETQLLLYALEQQALQGPCALGRPGGWGWGSTEEVAKWQSWKALGDMSRVEAMRLFVRTVEEEQVGGVQVVRTGYGLGMEDIAEGGGCRRGSCSSCSLWRREEVNTAATDARYQ